MACLAGPPGTAASHLTAAALFGMAKPAARPHVTVPPGVSGRIRVAVVHKAPLSRRDVCVVGLEYLGERHQGPRDWTHDAREDGIRSAGWRIEGVDRFDLRPGATRLRAIPDSVFGVRRRVA